MFDKRFNTSGQEIVKTLAEDQRSEVVLMREENERERKGKREK